LELSELLIIDSGFQDICDSFLDLPIELDPYTIGKMLLQEAFNKGNEKLCLRLVNEKKINPMLLNQKAGTVLNQALSKRMIGMA